MIEKKSISAKTKKLYKNIFDGVWTYTLLSFLAILWIIPILWIVLTAFRASPGLISTTFFPQEYTLDNFLYLFKTNNPTIMFGTWYLNTLIIAVINTVVSTIITLSTAFALSRFRFKSRKNFMNIALILGMFPGFMAMVAIYLILNMINMLNTSFALLVIYACGSGLGFYVSKGFFDTIPLAIDESAMIDGASQFKIFVKMILPLSKPIIIYTAMLAFMAPWMDFILAGILLSDPKQQTVAVGLYNMILEQNVNIYFTKFAAGCVIVAIPIVVVYIWLQRYMIEGVSAGAVKG